MADSFKHTMNTFREIDLVSLLKDKVLEVYGALSYADLCGQVKNLQPYSYQNEIEIANPDYYQMEIDVVFDNAKFGPIRILGFIDDGKSLYGSYSRIISPDGNLVSEGGSIKRRGK